MSNYVQKFAIPIIKWGRNSIMRAWQYADILTPAALFFLVISLTTGFLIASILPLGQAADEPAQAIRIEAIANGILLGHREGLDGGVTTASALELVGHATVAQAAQTKETRNAAEAVNWNIRPRFHEIGTIATYFPVVYIPAAVAVEFARWLRETPAQAFRAARRTNVVCFAILGAVSIQVATRGVAFLTSVLLLPMSLGVAASLSGDGFLIGFAALASALLSRDERWSWMMAAVLITLIALTKLPYAPLFLCLLSARQSTQTTKLITVFFGLVLSFAWAFYNQKLVMGTLTRAPYLTGPLWPGEPRTFTSISPMSQLQVLRSTPFMSAKLIGATLTKNWHSLLKSTIGVLGWQHISLPQWIYNCWKFVLALTLAALVLEKNCWQKYEPLFTSFALIGSVCAIMLSMYLGWTKVGAPVIDGVQGRYFLPILPFLCSALPGINRPSGEAIWIAPIILGIVGVVSIPEVLALASYLK